MFHTTDVRDTGFLLTLEELGQLATAGTRPAETLMNVVALIANRFDADLLRIRKVRVTLRVQVGLKSLRGPTGPLFLRGGTARGGERYIPDQEISFEVTPRNLNFGR